MRLVVLAPPEMAAEFNLKFAGAVPGWQPVYVHHPNDLAAHLEQAEVVFDFRLVEHPEQLQVYASYSHLTVFVNAVLVQLAAVAAQVPLACTVFGFNGLPTLFNRPQLEVSILQEEDEPKLRTVCQNLGTMYLQVADRVGMVTPRVLCMLMNEACFVLQEETAGCGAIDESMRLGTSYPKGPFEWANQLGAQTVYKVLEAVYTDTRDERYKVCPLLKTKALKQELF